MATNHIMSETIPVRITRKRHRELRRIAKANGHTISWLLNYALDLYFQSLEPQPVITDPKPQAAD